MQTVLLSDFQNDSTSSSWEISLVLFLKNIELLWSSSNMMRSDVLVSNYSLTCVCIVYFIQALKLNLTLHCQSVGMACKCCLPCGFSVLAKFCAPVIIPYSQQSFTR